MLKDTLDQSFFNQSKKGTVMESNSKTQKHGMLAPAIDNGGIDATAVRQNKSLRPYLMGEKDGKTASQQLADIEVICFPGISIFS